MKKASSTVRLKRLSKSFSRLVLRYADASSDVTQYRHAYEYTKAALGARFV